MTAIMTFLTGVVALGITTLIFNTLWGGVTFIFNTLMDAQFTSFTGLNSFIRILSKMPEGNEFTLLLQKISMILLVIVLLFSILKSMAYPMTGKESPQPFTILMKAMIASLFIGFYPTIVDFIIEILNTFASSSLFHTSIDLGVIDVTGLSIASFLDIGILMNMIAIIAIFTGMLMAAVSYLERYLSFALYIALGPICFAFYPGKDTESLLREWFMGVLSQIFGILICMFALTMVGNQLEGIGFIDGLDPNNVVGTTTIAKLLVALALLGFVRNSEQFINMLGLRTMPNQDAARSFLGAFATTAGLGVAAFKGISAGKEAIGKYFNGEKMGAAGIGTVLNKQGKAMVDQASQVHGTPLKDQTKDRQIASAKAIAQTQLAQGSGGNKAPMDKKDFMKWQERVGVGHANSNEAYAAYKNELAQAQLAKSSVLSTKPTVDANGNQSYSVASYKGQGNGQASARSVSKADLSTGLVNKYNTGVTPVSNAMEFTSEAMQSRDVRGFAFMGEVVGPDGKTTQKPMAAFVGKEIMNEAKGLEGKVEVTPSGAHEAIDPTIMSSGKFYGVDPYHLNGDQVSESAYIPFGSNGEFHTAENGIMVAELKETVPYSIGGSIDKETEIKSEADHYVAYFGMNSEGDFQISHASAPVDLNDLKADLDDHLSNLYVSQFHTEKIFDDKGEATGFTLTSAADSLYSIQQELIKPAPPIEVPFPMDAQQAEIEEIFSVGNEESGYTNEFELISESSGEKHEAQ